MNIYSKLQESRPEILAIAAKHGAYNVRIFGSVARHEADSASDLDLLVEMEPERSLLDLEAIERIEKYSCRGRQSFVDDELIQNWIWPISKEQEIKALKPAKKLAEIS